MVHLTQLGGSDEDPRPVQGAARPLLGAFAKRSEEGSSELLCGARGLEHAGGAALLFFCGVGLSGGASIPGPLLLLKLLPVR